MDEKGLKLVSAIVFFTGLALVIVLSLATPKDFSLKAPEPMENPSRVLEGTLLSQRQTAKSTILELLVESRIKVVVFDRVEFPQNSRLEVQGSLQEDMTLFADSILQLS